jgi:hypothetical protein
VPCREPRCIRGRNAFEKEDRIHRSRQDTIHDLGHGLFENVDRVTLCYKEQGVSMSRTLIVAAVLANLAMSASAQTHQPPKTDAEKIANAMSAGPASVSHGATIITMDGDKMRTLRQGTNGFTCMPDDPGSPGNDPMCLDKIGMAWLQAWMDHKDAPKGQVGLVYMLQGGSDASNDDPFATKPAAGQKWVTTGPHVMMVGMAGSLGDITRSPANPKQPFIMWGGSSYEHIMMPVR